MTEYRVDQFFIIRNSMEGRACVNILLAPVPRDLSPTLLGVGCWAEGELRSGMNDEASVYFFVASSAGHFVARLLFLSSHYSLLLSWLR